MAGFNVGDRVKWRAAFDPMTSFNEKYGFNSPLGTIDDIDDSTCYVVWDTNEGPATGSCSLHEKYELEVQPRSAP